MNSRSMSSIPQAYENRKGRRNLNEFPGTYGLPILGHTLKLVNDPRKMDQDFYHKYGRVYQAGIGFRNTLTIHGPEAAEMFFMDKDNVFSSGLGLTELKRVFPGFLLIRDFEEHKFHRKLLTPLFKKEYMENYIHSMNQYMLNFKPTWNNDEKVPIYPLIKETALGMAASVFMGQKEVKEIEAFSRAFTDLVDSLMALVMLPIPGNKTWKGQRARKYLYRTIHEHIAQHKYASDAKDMLSHMTSIEDEDGNKILPEEIMGHMVGFLFAAHDTTTSNMCALCYILGKETDWQDKLRKELMALNKDYLEFDDFEKLPEMDKVIKETLRLYPPSSQTFRRTIKPVEFDGFTIPENTYVRLSMDFIHQMPEYWSEPQKFDPERFSKERSEHKKHSFQYIPFGGGAHKCIGMHFADFEVKTVLFHILKNFRIEVDPGYEVKYHYLPVPKPRDNLPLKLIKL